MINNSEPDDGKRIAKFIDNMRRAVNGNEALFDLRSFDLVFIPIHEHGHYYLVAFELKYPGIWVIDNLNEYVLLVKLKDSDDYFQKEASYKVVRHNSFNDIKKISLSNIVYICMVGLYTPGRLIPIKTVMLYEVKERV
jgi:hypothetical protein